MQIGRGVAVLIAQFVAVVVRDVVGLPALFVVLETEGEEFGFGVVRQPAVRLAELFNVGGDGVAQFDVFVPPPF